MERLTFTATCSGCKISIPRDEVENAWIEKHPSGAFIIMASRIVWVKENPLEMLKELQDKRKDREKVEERND